jgi:hypothetical protein
VRHLMVAALALLARTLPAQDMTRAQTDYGIRHWVVPIELPANDTNMSRADLAKFARRLQTVMTRLSALPEFAGPAEKRCHELTVVFPFEQPVAPQPARAFVEANLYDWYENKCHVSDRFNFDEIKLFVNDPQAAISYPPRTDSIGKFHGWKGPLPRAGISQYENFTVVTRPDAPPLLVEVTKERYVRYLIAEAEERVTQRKASAAKQPGTRRGPTAAEKHEKWQSKERPKAIKSIDETLAALRQAGKTESELAALRTQMLASIATTDSMYAREAAREREPLSSPPATTATLERKMDRNDQLNVEDLESLRAQLAALTPQQRSASACSGPPVKMRFIDECTAKITFVTTNPAFFNNRPPRADMHRVVIRSGSVPRTDRTAAQGFLTPLWNRLRDVTLVDRLIKEQRPE